jgi:hypothetical protein
VGLEFVDGAFDDVALLVGFGVERRWPPTLAAPAAGFLLSAGSGMVALIRRFRR